MKNIKKHLISSLIALVLSSCGGSNNQNKNNEINFYSFDNDKTLLLSAYLSPTRMDKKYFDWAKEAGLTHMYIDYYTSETENASHIMEQSLDFCDEVGLKTIPMANWGSSSYRSWQDHPLLDTMETHPSFDGFNILDEPVYEDYDKLAEEVEAYYNKFPNRPFYTNMLRPGNPKSGFSHAKDKTYDQYISGFIDKVIKPIKEKGITPIMSQTLYPMMNDKYNGPKFIMESHLTDLAKFQQQADSIGATKYHFVQTVSFGNSHHATDPCEISFQIYCGLAFGYDGFQYFTYWTPAAQGGEFQSRDYAMINRSLERSKQYYGVQAINKEITNIQNVLLSFEYKGLILVNGKKSTEECKPFEAFRNNVNFETLEKTENMSVVSASEDTLISYMTDKDNHEGYMVVNYSLPTAEKQDDVLLKFSNAKAVMVYINGEEQRIPADTNNFKKGVLSLNLKEGQGAFVVPVF